MVMSHFALRIARRSVSLHAKSRQARAKGEETSAEEISAHEVGSMKSCARGIEEDGADIRGTVLYLSARSPESEAPRLCG
jgi:hypothetical protein